MLIERQIDFIDRKIFQQLIADARKSFSQIATALKVSNTLVHQRVKKMSETGLITGYGVRLNSKILGFDSVTYTGIVTKEAHYAYNIAEELQKIPQVVECHWVSGKYALFIKIVARNNEDLRKILYERIHKIEGVGGTDSFISFGAAFEKDLPVDS
jgi:Lrp/AsnC family transcriptional regulator, regulator for asnA, asnC and gidA